MSNKKQNQLLLIEYLKSVGCNFVYSEKEVVDEFLTCNANITTRQLAIKKWNLLTDEDKKQYYDNYVNSGKFTMALSFKELTGSEVEFILTNTVG